VALSFVPRQPETNEHKRIATATRIVSKYALSSAVGRVVAFEQEELEEREGYKAGMDTSIRSSCGHPSLIRLLTLVFQHGDTEIHGNTRRRHTARLAFRPPGPRVARLASLETQLAIQRSPCVSVLAPWPPC